MVKVLSHWIWNGVVHHGAVQCCAVRCGVTWCIVALRHTAMACTGFGVGLESYWKVRVKEI